MYVVVKSVGGGEREVYVALQSVAQVRRNILLAPC